MSVHIIMHCMTGREEEESGQRSRGKHAASGLDVIGCGRMIAKGIGYK